MIIYLGGVNNGNGNSLGNLQIKSHIYFLAFFNFIFIILYFIIFITLLNLSFSLF